MKRLSTICIKAINLTSIAAAFVCALSTTKGTAATQLTTPQTITFNGANTSNSINAPIGASKIIVILKGGNGSRSRANDLPGGLGGGAKLEFTVNGGSAVGLEFKPGGLASTPYSVWSNSFGGAGGAGAGVVIGGAFAYVGGGGGAGDTYWAVGGSGGNGAGFGQVSTAGGTGGNYDQYGGYHGGAGGSPGNNGIGGIGGMNYADQYNVIGSGTNGGPFLGGSANEGGGPSSGGGGGGYGGGGGGGQGDGSGGGGGGGFGASGYLTLSDAGTTLSPLTTAGIQYTFEYNPLVTFTFGNLSQTYTGTTRSATVTPSPTGITFNITYNGSASAPILAGSYTVTATVTQSGYTGVGSSTLFVYSPLTTQVGIGNGTASGGGNFLPGAVAPISATPAPNFKFDNWTIVGTGTLTGPASNASNGVTLGNTFTQATANFSHITHNLTVSITPSTVGGSTTPSGTNTVNQGDIYTLTPFQTATGHYFDRWEQTDGAGTLLGTLATATDATPLQTGSITIGAADAFVRAVYLPKTTPSLSLTSPVSAIPMSSAPFSLVASTNSSNPVTFALRSPTTIATLSGSTITLTEPRTAGIIPLTLSVADSRRFFAATIDADVAISSGTASITFKESSASRFVLPGARVSANQVPQQLVNAYSDAQLLMVVPTSWKTANPISGTDTASGYLERYLLTQGNTVQARADLTAAFVAANPTTKTYYQIASDAYAAKLLADAGNTGGTVNPPIVTPPVITNPPIETGPIGSASNPYPSLTALGSAVTASSSTIGQTAYVGTTVYKVMRTSTSPVTFEWVQQ